MRQEVSLIFAVQLGYRSNHAENKKTRLVQKIKKLRTCMRALYVIAQGATSQCRLVRLDLSAELLAAFTEQMHIVQHNCTEKIVQRRSP